MSGGKRRLAFASDGEMCLFQQLALCDVVTATSHADAVGLLEKEGKNVLLLEGTNPFPRSLEGGRAWSLEGVVEAAAAAAAAAGAGVAATDRAPGASVDPRSLIKLLGDQTP